MRSATRNWRHPMPKSRLECNRLIAAIRSALKNGRGTHGEVRKIMHADFGLRMVRVAIGLVLILVIVGYSAFGVITTGQVLGIDARLFLVIAPVLGHQLGSLQHRSRRRRSAAVDDQAQPGLSPRAFVG